tara:strand:- start:27104 stop:27385 length:282 start_codon:yes stop_codon:yes gene_type:complete
MGRITKLGSNRYTNSTNVFGNMAGLAPTKNVRSFIPALPGYKYDVVQNNPTYYTECGLPNTPANGTACLKTLKLYTGSNSIGTFRTGRSKLLG